MKNKILGLILFLIFGIFISIVITLLSVGVLYLSLNLLGFENVHCGLVGCSTHSNYISQETFIEKNSRCIINGKEVDCSVFYEENKYWASKYGYNNNSGVCELNHEECFELAIENQKNNINVEKEE